MHVVVLFTQGKPVIKIKSWQSCTISSIMFQCSYMGILLFVVLIRDNKIKTWQFLHIKRHWTKNCENAPRDIFLQWKPAHLWTVAFKKYQSPLLSVHEIIKLAGGPRAPEAFAFLNHQQKDGCVLAKLRNVNQPITSGQNSKELGWKRKRMLGEKRQKLIIMPMQHSLQLFMPVCMCI